MNDKLKIGITCYPSLGGSGVVATELGKLLAEKGHEVHFIANSIPFRLGGAFQKIFFIMRLKLTIITCLDIRHMICHWRPKWPKSHK